MFNNANVLFKTAFVDGVSTVRRTAQSRQAKALDSASAQTAKENRRPGKKSVRGDGRSRAAISQRN